MMHRPATQVPRYARDAPGALSILRVLLRELLQHQDKLKTTNAMTAYIVRRLLYGVLTFLGITIVVFVLVHSVPGDPIDFYISQHMTHLSQAALNAIRHENHL